MGGSLTTLNPCGFPLLPLVLGGAVQENRLAPMAMGVGMVGAFAVLGLVVGVVGDALGSAPITFVWQARFRSMRSDLRCGCAR